MRGFIYLTFKFLSVSDIHKLVLYLYFLQACMQAFKRDGVRGNILDTLFIFSQLGLQISLTTFISRDFRR